MFCVVLSFPNVLFKIIIFIVCFKMLLSVLLLSLYFPLYIIMYTARLSRPRCLLGAAFDIITYGSLPYNLNGIKTTLQNSFILFLKFPYLTLIVIIFLIKLHTNCSYLSHINPRYCITWSIKVRIHARHLLFTRQWWNEFHICITEQKTVYIEVSCAQSNRCWLPLTKWINKIFCFVLMLTK